MTSFIPALTLPSQFFSIPAVAILAPIAVGSGVGYATRPKETQRTYLALKQPPLRPPPWIFGPVWTALYGLMGYSAYRAWTTGSLSVNPVTRDLAKQGATLYSLSLVMNYAWMPLFFTLERPILASVDILALSGTVGYLTYIWGQVDEISGWCLAPYCAWLGFASYLCIGCGYLNNWDFSGKEKRMPPTGGDGGKFVNDADKGL